MPVKVCRSSQIYPSKVLLFALGMDHGEYPTVLGVAIASRTWYKERICGNILAVWGSRFVTDSDKTAKKSPYSPSNRIWHTCRVLDSVFLGLLLMFSKKCSMGLSPRVHRRASCAYIDYHVTRGPYQFSFDH